MDWVSLAIAAYGKWSKDRAAEEAQGNPALALAAQRRGGSTGEQWVVTTGGSRATVERSDVLPGVDFLPLPNTSGVNPGEVYLADNRNQSTLMIAGAVVVAAFVLAKLK